MFHRSVAVCVLGWVCAVGAVRQARQSTQEWKAVLLPGQINITRPAFLFLDETKNEVVVSQFGRPQKPGAWLPNPFPAQSKLTKIPLAMLQTQARTGALSGNLTMSDEWVTDKAMQWPNKLSRTPAGIGDYIVVPDGFLPPGKENGGIYLADKNGKIHRITNKKEKGAFYHEVEFHDFNGDGLQDMLTARTVKTGTFSFKFTGTLLWYENPGKNVEQQWKQHVIADGPDVIFKSRPYKGGLAVFATEFFKDVPQVRVHFINSKGVQTSVRTIDQNLGKPFAVNFADLDGDGNDELLVTNHQNDDKDDIKAAVYAYEMPSDLEFGDYTRHTLAQGISSIKRQDPGVGSPGFATAFYPKEGMRGHKHIVAAGDGSFDVWYLRPTGKAFEYEPFIIDIGGTTGELLLNDFDGDGIMDILVPDNDYWKLQMITFEKR